MATKGKMWIPIERESIEAPKEEKMKTMKKILELFALMMYGPAGIFIVVMPLGSLGAFLAERTGVNPDMGLFVGLATGLGVWLFLVVKAILKSKILDSYKNK